MSTARANVIFGLQEAEIGPPKLAATAVIRSNFAFPQRTWIGSGQQPIIDIITIIKFIVIGRNGRRPQVGVVAELVQSSAPFFAGHRAFLRTEANSG